MIELAEVFTPEIRAEAREKLLEAKEWMNSDGAHWMQNVFCAIESPTQDYDLEDESAVSYFKKNPRACRFCSVGGYRAVVFDDPMKYVMPMPLAEYSHYELVYFAGLAALNAAFGCSVPDMSFTGDALDALDASPLDELETNIIGVNDHPQTNWNRVSNGFKEAADLIVAA